MVGIMELQHSENDTIQNPTKEDLFESVSSLDKSDESFLILVNAGEIFCQAIKNGENDYYIEYHLADTSDYFTTYNQTISKEDCIKFLNKYNDDDNSWKEMFNWQKDNLKQSGGCAPIFILSLGSMVTLSLLLLSK